MAKMCPKCSGDGDLDDVEENNGLCIHEKIVLTGISALVIVGALLASGIL